MRKWIRQEVYTGKWAAAGLNTKIPPPSGKYLKSAHSPPSPSLGFMTAGRRRQRAVQYGLRGCDVPRARRRRKNYPNAAGAGWRIIKLTTRYASIDVLKNLIKVNHHRAAHIDAISGWSIGVIYLSAQADEVRFNKMPRSVSGIITATGCNWGPID